MRVLLRGFVWGIVGGLVGFVPACLRIEHQKPPFGPGGWTIEVHAEIESRMPVQLGTIGLFIVLGYVYGVISGYVRTRRTPPRRVG
jgi:uncharacterized membrane protein